MTTTPDLKTILYEVADRVAVVTLNRPDRLNAWTRAHGEGVPLVPPDRGRRSRRCAWWWSPAPAAGFCAGADIKALDQLADGGAYPAAASRPDDRSPRVAPVPPDFDHPHSFPLSLGVPVIAAVNGPVAGVGFVLMCFTDIRFAAAGAELTTTSFRVWACRLSTRCRGCYPASSARPAPRSAVLSSRVVLAEEAAELGLVNKVLPPEDLLSFTLNYAAHHRRRDVALVASHHQASALGGPHARRRPCGRRRLRADGRDGVRDKDFAEGVAAFGEKRLPKFSS